MRQVVSLPGITTEAVGTEALEPSTSVVAKWTLTTIDITAISSRTSVTAVVVGSASVPNPASISTVVSERHG